jgi:cell division protease FtsH
MVATLLAGNASEELVYNEISSGAADDIKRATALARRMVTDLGMSDVLGPRTFGDKQELVFLGREISEQKDYGEKIADTIDKEVNRIIWEAHETARSILTGNQEKLEQLAAKLITQETLEGEELERVFGEIGVAERQPVVKKTTVPEPVKPIAEGEPVVQPKKVPGVPRLVPKQTPAAD